MTGKRNRMIYFVINLILFIVIDILNMPYNMMFEMYGFWMVSVNIVLTVLMAGISTLIFSDSLKLLEKYGTYTSGESVSVFAMIFAFITYGCTPCVVSIFASLGISFSVYVLPFEGLPYKLIALGLLIIGKILSIKSVENIECRMKES